MYCSLLPRPTSERMSPAPRRRPRLCSPLIRKDSDGDEGDGDDDDEGRMWRNRGERASKRETSIQNRKKKLARSGSALRCSTCSPLPVRVCPPPSSLPARSLARFQIEYRKASVRKKRASDGRVRRQMNRVLMGYWMHAVAVVGWSAARVEKSHSKKICSLARPSASARPCFPQSIGGVLGGGLNFFNNSYEY